MAINRLRKGVVEQAEAEGRDAFVWDAELPGFGVRVFASGKRSYLVQYKVGRRTRRITIGAHGVLTPDEARKRARRLLAEVACGRDPAEARAEERAALSVTQLADLYLKEGPAEKPNKKASNWGTDRSNIERHIKPLLGRKLVKSLSQADIARFQADVAVGKTAKDEKTGIRGRAIVKDGKDTAARSLAVLGAMLQFAVGRKLILANPAKGVSLLKGEKRTRYLSDAEVVAIGETLDVMERQRTISSTMAAAICLLMMTGCRKSEILGLRWSEVDFQRAALVLPNERSKTGAKRVPIADVVVDLLRTLPRSSPYVLPAARGEGHVVGLQKVWEEVRRQTKLDDVRLHDLRHSFASFAVSDGATLYLVGKVLGHRQAKTTEGYAHVHDDPVQAITNRTAARIAANMNKAVEKPVVEGRRRYSLLQMRRFVRSAR